MSAFQAMGKVSMDAKSFLEALARYQADMEGVLSRFKKTGSGIHIQPDDDRPYRQTVIECIDLINDTLGVNDYTKMIANHFNEGISNFFESPSCASVQRIIGVLGAVSTRISRSPDLVGRPKREANSQSATVEMESTDASHILEPNKLPLSWFFHKVPAKIWVTLGGIVIATFVAGAHLGQTTFIRELIGQQSPVKEPQKQNIGATSMPSVEAQVKELTQAHNSRVSQIQSALLEQEKIAAGSLAYRDLHLKAAENLRSDLQRENAAFNVSIEALQKLQR